MTREELMSMPDLIRADVYDETGHPDKAAWLRLWDKLKKHGFCPRSKSTTWKTVYGTMTNTFMCHCNHCKVREMMKRMLERKWNYDWNRNSIKSNNDVLLTKQDWSELDDLFRQISKRASDFPLEMELLGLPLFSTYIGAI